METTICDSGLYPYLDHDIREFPIELHEYCGKGLGIWQYPCQLADYLNYILDTNKNISSYAEVGTGAGGTFIFTCNLLGKTRGLGRSYAVDIADPGRVHKASTIYNPYDATLEVYVYRNKSTCKFIKGNSIYLVEELIRKQDSLDLVFIDADHTYESVKRDFQVLKDVSKIIAIGGLKKPGVWAFWNEVKNKGDYKCQEFCRQYNCVSQLFGIGVIEKYG